MSHKTRWVVQLGGLLLIVTTAFGLATWESVGAQDKPTPAQQQSITQAKTLSTAFRYVADTAAPSVVTIQTKTRTREVSNKLKSRGGNPFKGTPFENMIPEDMQPEQPQQRQEGLGSGIIIDAAGIILTNRHVVSGADEVLVRLHDGREYKATDVKTDDQTDLAIVRIEKVEGLKAAKLGESSKMEIGDWVVAVGNPFGLELSVTSGIISAKGRGLRQGGAVNYLQTDAAINPGNSGGPLFNLDGEVIGINTAIASSSGGFQGIGFAIPVDTAKWVSKQLVENGNVKRAYLGVAIQDLTDDLARNFNVRPQSGVLISNVLPNTPAADAGIKTGDIVTSFAGEKVHNSRDLQAVVQRLPFGSKHAMEYVRDGKNATAQVTVRPMPTDMVKQASLQSGEEEAPAKAPATRFGGIEVSDLTAEVAKQLNLEGQKGVVITEVEPGSVANEAGLETGNLIVRVGQTPVTTVAEFQAAVKEHNLDKGVLLLVSNGQGSRFIVLKN